MLLLSLLLHLQLKLLLLPVSWLLQELGLVAHLVGGLHVDIPLLLALQRSSFQGCWRAGGLLLLLLLQAGGRVAGVVISSRLEAVCAPEWQAIGHKHGRPLMLLLLLQVC